MPDGSGDPIGDANPSGLFWLLQGRPNNQVGYGGTSSGGTATISSTRNSTKGFVYLGGSDGVAFDETNTLLGIGQSSPQARLDIRVPNSVDQSGAPTSVTSSSHIVASSGTILDCITSGGGSTWARYEDTGFNGSLVVHLEAASDPGVTSGFSIKFTLRSTSDSGCRMTIALDNASGGTSIMDVANQHFAGAGDTLCASDPTHCLGKITTGFAEYTLTLSATEVGRIDFNSHLILSLGFSLSANGSTFDIDKIEYIAPPVGGSGSPTTLQIWSTPSIENDLDFTDDGAGSTTLDLTMTGDAPFRIGSGGGTSGLRLLTSSTNARLEAGTSAQSNMNLVLSGARDATGTLLTSKFSNTTLTGTATINGGTPATGGVFYSTNSSGLGAWTAAGTTSQVLIGGSTPTFGAVPAAALDVDLQEIAAVNNVRGDLLVTDSTPSWVRLPIGTANQVLGVHATLADPEYKTIQGAANEIDVTHGAGTITIGLIDPLIVGKGGSGAATLTGLLQGNGTSAFTAVTNSTTVGQVLRVTGSNTYGWGAVDLDDTDAVTGTLGVANGGTNLASGTSGGILGFTGTTTLASSALLAANGVVYGGGAGATPAATAAGTTSQVLIGGTPPSFAAISAAMLPAHDHSSGSQGGATLAPTQVYVSGGAAGTVPTKITATAAQTADLLQVFSAAGNKTFYLDSTGAVYARRNDGSGAGFDFAGGQFEITEDAIGSGSILWRHVSVTNNRFLLSGYNVSNNSFWYLPRVSSGVLLAGPDISSGSGDMPAAGALLYGTSASAALSALAIGSSGTILTSSGSAPQWSTNASVVDVARTWATLQKFPDNLFNIVGSSNATKIARFEVDGFTASTTRVFTLPDSDMTVAGININQAWSTGTQTYQADIFKIEAATGSTFVSLKDLDSSFSALLAFANTLTNDFSLLIPTTTGASSTLVTTDATQTITNKTLSVTGNILRVSTRTSGVSFADNSVTTKRVRHIQSGLLASTDNVMEFRGTAERTWTFPDADGSLAQDTNTACYEGEVLTYEDDLLLVA